MGRFHKQSRKATVPASVSREARHPQKNGAVLSQRMEKDNPRMQIEVNFGSITDTEALSGFSFEYCHFSALCPDP